jgi:PAS domain S-box-containing protein
VSLSDVIDAFTQPAGLLDASGSVVHLNQAGVRAGLGELCAALPLTRLGDHDIAGTRATLTAGGDGMVVVTLTEPTTEPETRFHATVEAIHEGVVLLDPVHEADGLITDLVPTYANPAFLELWSGAPVTGDAASGLLPDTSALLDDANAAWRGERTPSRVTSFDDERYPTGSLRADHVEYRVTRAGTQILVTAIDRSDDHAAALRYATTLEALNEAVALVNVTTDDVGQVIDATLVYANDALAATLSTSTAGAQQLLALYRSDPAHHQHIEDVLGPAVRALFAPLSSVVHGDGPWSREIDLRGTGTGLPDRVLHVTISATRTPGQAVVVFADRTAEVEAAEQLATSEALFRSMADSLLHPITLATAVLDDAGTLVDARFTYANAAAEHQTGRTCTGRLISEVYNDFGDVGLPANQAAWAGGIGRFLVDNTDRHVPGMSPSVLDGTTQRLADGSLLTIAFDRTDAELLQREVATNRAFLRCVLNSLSEALIICDERGIAIDVNPAAAVLLGTTPEDLIGRDATDACWSLLDDDGNVVDPQTRRRFVTGEASLRSAELTLCRPDGSTVPVSITTHPVVGAAGGGCTVALIVDLSELHAQRSEIVRAAAEHRRTLDALAAGIQVLRPIWDAERTTVVDAEVRFLNRAKLAMRHTDHIIGHPISETMPAGPARTSLLRDVTAAVLTGAPVDSEVDNRDGTHPTLSVRFAERRCIALDDGDVVVSYLDRSAQHAAEERFTMVVDGLAESVCITEPVLDGDGRLVDLRIVYENPVAIELSALGPVVGALVSEVWDGLDVASPMIEQAWYDGLTVSHTTDNRTKAVSSLQPRVINMTVQRIGDLLIWLGSDRTEWVAMVERQRHTGDVLTSTLAHMAEALLVFEVVRDTTPGTLQLAYTNTAARKVLSVDEVPQWLVSRVTETWESCEGHREQCDNRSGSMPGLAIGVFEISIARAADRVLVTALDRTAEHEATTALVEVAEQRRGLLARLVQVREVERRSLAVALHDGAIQSLSASRFDLSALARRVDDSLVADVEAAKASLDVAIADLREQTFVLYPPVLMALGLDAALHELIERFGSDTSCRLGVATNLGDRRLDEPSEQLLYRTTQELVRNALKHAQPSLITVHVRLDAAASVVHLEVCDDGVGFDVGADWSAASSDRFGLRSCQQLVEMADGTFTVVSTQGSGTVVRAELPIRSEPD